jgi:hypothetical protein
MVGECLRVLAVAVVLADGCASTTARTPGQNPRIAEFEQQSQEIDENENRCISEAATTIDRQIASLAAGTGTSDNPQTQKLAVERDRKMFECRAKADREREELSAQVRADYQARAQEQRDLESLMMILTTSRPP